MSDVKKVRSQLKQLTRAQLIALAVQKTGLPYQNALQCSKEELVTGLEGVEGVFKPVQA